MDLSKVHFKLAIFINRLNCRWGNPTAVLKCDDDHLAGFPYFREVLYIVTCRQYLVGALISKPWTSHSVLVQYFSFRGIFFWWVTLPSFQSSKESIWETATLILARWTLLLEYDLNQFEAKLSRPCRRRTVSGFRAVHILLGQWDRGSGYTVEGKKKKQCVSCQCPGCWPWRSRVEG